jgi:hypothetical protein
VGFEAQGVAVHRPVGGLEAQRQAKGHAAGLGDGGKRQPRVVGQHREHRHDFPLERGLNLLRWTGGVKRDLAQDGHGAG